MTQTEQQKSAKLFAENWANKGDEKQETQRYWIGILGEVLGVVNPQNYIEFEKKVKRVESRHCERSDAISESEKDCHTDSEFLRNSNAKNRNETKIAFSPRNSTTNFIDAYIPDTKVLIEQKGIKIDLNKAYEQSDGTVLTPYEQAKRYVNDMKASEKPRWIVVCNFAEFDVYDLENPQNPPEIIFLKDLEKDYYRLEFLVDRKNENIRREVDISVAAGTLVGKMYDALVKEYINPTAESYRSLNVLCVRLVFCFYAEDAGLFETRTSFEDYIKSFAIENLRDGMIKLFKALDTKLENRDKYDLKLNPFPYVNGGLFHDENIEIPNFTQEIVDVLVNDCAPFDWHEISPTIFGAVFESTLNPDTRRKGGMHYTSIENIHKVIDPLFLDGLNEEFNKIIGIKNGKNNMVIEPVETTNKGDFDKLNHLHLSKQQQQKLFAFQNKLGSLTFLDPACGSGNFLTETYLSLRRLENKVISALNKGEKVLGFDEFIKVKISQFYGIEINDFAVTVAKTALWIAESQMINETEKIISQQIDFLPLKTQANIVEGNALRMNWATLTNLDGTKAEQPMLFDFENEENAMVGRKDAVVEFIETTNNGKSDFDRLNDRHSERSEESHHYDYIMGNPPFVGTKYQSQKQKEDILQLSPALKPLDYVTGWYKKALDLIKDTDTKCAFVSTNSITQGEQVALLWKPLFADGLEIDFAYRTFKWDSESSEVAHVHCVIIGFSVGAEASSHQKFIFTESGEKINAKNINGYLLDADNLFIENRKKPLCNVPEITMGSMPNDGGYLLLKEDEKNEMIKKSSLSEKYIKQIKGSEELINNKKLYCLWLTKYEPSEIKKCPEILNRIDEVRKTRSASSRPSTKKLAETPMLFAEIRQPDSNYIAIPKVSSEKRRYIPIAFETPEVIAKDQLFIVPNADLYIFGVLTSNVHNDWNRAVCGRLETRYNYSSGIVYNNFPWPDAVFEKKSVVVEPVETTRDGKGDFDKLNHHKATIKQTAQLILDVRAKYPASSLADLYDTLSMPPDLRKAHEANDRAVMQAYGFDEKMTEAEIVSELFRMYEKLDSKLRFLKLGNGTPLAERSEAEQSEA